MRFKFHSGISNTCNRANVSEGMSRRIRWVWISGLQLAVVVPLLVFIMGAVAADRAVRPVRKPVPPVCPCVAHVRCRDAQTTSADGTVLKGWYYEPDAPNGSALLMLHGVGDNRVAVVGLGTVYEKAGYSVLVPDLRGHGESGGLISYGIQDEADVRAWANWMQAQPGVGNLYGFGASLGGSVLLESLRTETRFSAVIAESAYSDFPSIAEERVRRNAPAALKWMTPPVVASGILWTRLRYGIDLRASSATDGVRHSKTPILLAHGLADYLTSPDNSRVLASANPALTQLWLVPGAAHANLWAKAKREFEERTLAWLASHVLSKK